MLEKICEVCGEGFVVTRKRERNKRFCGQKCWEVHDANTGRPERRLPPAEFACRECGKPFFMKQSYLKEHRKRFGKDPAYCSIECSAIGRRKDSDERNKRACKNCGKIFSMRRRENGTLMYGGTVCSPVCRQQWKLKITRANRGERPITKRVKRGYVILRIPGPGLDPDREILEHRYVMEQVLGRKLLPEETVHHINGNRQNNSPDNLELFSSNHGPGQRVTDKVTFAIEILRLYPEFGRAQGAELVDHEPVPVFTVPAPVQALVEPPTERC